MPTAATPTAFGGLRSKETDGTDALPTNKPYLVVPPLGSRSDLPHSIRSYGFKSGNFNMQKNQFSVLVRRLDLVTWIAIASIITQGFIAIYLILGVFSTLNLSELFVNLDFDELLRISRGFAGLFFFFFAPTTLTLLIAPFYGYHLYKRINVGYGYRIFEFYSYIAGFYSGNMLCALLPLF